MKMNETDTELDELLDGFENTKLIREAESGSWDGVRELLRQGADARWKNGFGVNALYYALEAGEIDLAIELFDAGARLDALNGEQSLAGARGNGLVMAAELRRTGRDVFRDEKNTLSECCRWGLYDQAEEKINGADKAELDLAVYELIRSGRYCPERNLKLLQKVLDRGGEIDPVQVERYANYRPHQFRNPPEYTEAVRRLMPEKKAGIR